MAIERYRIDAQYVYIHWMVKALKFIVMNEETN